MTISALSELPEQSEASVGIVILNFNGKKLLRKCLDSLLATRYPRLQIIVVDNASDDGSADLVKACYPNVQVVEHNRNHGFAQGYNLIMGNVSSDYIAIVNNDITVEPDWLLELVRVLKTSRSIAAVTPKMLFMHNPAIVNAAGGCCDVFGVGFNRGNGEVDAGQFERVEEVFYGNGGALLISKEAWLDIGLFDDRYFMYAEDLDWCWRARLKGYSVVYVPNSRVYHKWRGSRESRMVYMLERHWLSTFIKNYSMKTQIFLLPKLAGLKSMKMLWLVRFGKPNEKYAIVRAFLWNLVHFRATWKKRVSVQASRRISDADLFKLMHQKSLELSLWLGILDHPILERK